MITLEVFCFLQHLIWCACLLFVVHSSPEAIENVKEYNKMMRSHEEMELLKVEVNNSYDIILLK